MGIANECVSFLFDSGRSRIEFVPLVGYTYSTSLRSAKVQQFKAFDGGD